MKHADRHRDALERATGSPRHFSGQFKLASAVDLMAGHLRQDRSAQAEAAQLDVESIVTGTDGLAIGHAALGLCETLGAGNVGLDLLQIGFAGVEGRGLGLVEIAFFTFSFRDDSSQRVDFRRALLFQSSNAHFMTPFVGKPRLTSGQRVAAGDGPFPRETRMHRR